MAETQAAKEAMAQGLGWHGNRFHSNQSGDGAPNRIKETKRNNNNMRDFVNILWVLNGPVLIIIINICSSYQHTRLFDMYMYVG